MLSCRELARIIAADELAAAGWRRRLTGRLHVLMCRHCRRYEAQMRVLGRTARRLWRGHIENEDPSTLARLESRILRGVAGRPPGPPHGDPPEGNTI